MFYLNLVFLFFLYNLKKIQYITNKRHNLYKVTGRIDKHVTPIYFREYIDTKPSKIIDIPNVDSSIYYNKYIYAQGNCI